MSEDEKTIDDKLAEVAHRGDLADLARADTPLDVPTAAAVLEATDTESSETASEMETKWAKAIAAAGVPTEAEMRASEPPRCNTYEELIAYMKTLIDRPHDYGTVVYAMSLSAVAAFRFVAGQLGASGFQAQCADLDVLRRLRGYEHGFGVVNVDRVFEPNDDIIESVRLALNQRLAGDEIKEEAQKKIAEHPDAPPERVQRWRAIAEGQYAV